MSIHHTAIVILNFNGKKHLEIFLPPLIKHSGSHKIIIADNGSTDESIPFLEQNYPSIEIIKITSNLGFCGGYNTALTQIQAKYYILLNSDVEVTPNWISPIIDLMEKDTTIAACQPKILAYHEKNKFEYAGAAGGFIDFLGYPFCRGRIFDTIEYDTNQYDDVCQIFWASGACLFIRSEIFHQIGGFDKDFFAHMEEIDLCWRINSSGYKVYYSGQSTVFHVGGGTLAASNPKKTFLNFRNNLSLLTKNLPLHQALWKIPLRFYLDGLAGIKFLLSGSPKSMFAIIKAHWNFLLSNVWKDIHKRKHIQKLKRVKNTPYIYPKSIVWKYFIKKTKCFNNLNW